MLTPLDNTIKEVMILTWPMIVISILTIASIRLVYLIKNKKSFVLYKELLALFFLIYILCLFQVVTFQDVPTHGIASNFIPFKEITRYQFGSRLFLKQVIGNLIMFVPYGFFVSYYIKDKKPYLPLFLITFASVSIELTQLLSGRVFDIDDIILNVIGGFIGYLCYHFFERILAVLPKFFRNAWILNLLAILVVIAFMCYVYWVVL